MTTVNDLVNQVSRIALGSQRQIKNKLASDVTSTSGTTATMTYDTGAMQTGTTVECGAELWYVWASNSSTKTITIERGYDGTTAATAASSTLVTVNPRFTKRQIIDEVNFVLGELSSPMHRLFQTVEIPAFTYTAGTDGYDLTASSSGMIEVLEVRYQNPGDPSDWVLARDWEVDYNAATSDFASGNALYFRNSAPPSGQEIRVLVAKGFTAISALTDNLTTTGLPATCYDILYLGAALRVLSVREIPRNWTGAQGDARRAEEVPPGALLNSTRDLRALYNSRISQEAAGLLKKYPYRMKGWYI